MECTKSRRFVDSLDILTKKMLTAAEDNVAIWETSLDQYNAAVNGCLLDNNPTVSVMYSETTTATEYYTGIKYIDVLDYMELSEYSSRLSRCVTDLCNYADHCDHPKKLRTILAIVRSVLQIVAQMPDNHNPNIPN